MNTIRIKQLTIQRHQLTKQLNKTNQEYYKLIQQAHKNKTPISQIAKATGLSKQRCYQIINGQN